MNLPHKSGCEAEEEERREDNEARDTRCQTTEGRSEGCEEPKDVKNETDQVEDPAEAPHIVIVCAGGVFSMLAMQNLSVVSLP